MSRKADLRLLECKSDATPTEINYAYERLLRRYGAGSLASYGLFRVHERHKFLQALQEAFRRLVSNSMGSFYQTPVELPLVSSGIAPEPPSVAPTEMVVDGPVPESYLTEHPTQADPVPPVRTAVKEDWGHQMPLLDTEIVESQGRDVYNTTDIPLDVEAFSREEELRTLVQQKQKTQRPEEHLLYTAWQLRDVRISQGLSLGEAASLSQIPEKVLFQIEAPNFGMFESDLQRLRKILISYAQVLTLDQHKVVQDYFESYWMWYAEHGKSR